MEWLWAILSAIFMLWSLIHLYRQYRTITSYHPKANHTDNSLPFSIILCTEGNAPRLISYIEKILQQTYDHFELIIVSKNTPREILNNLYQKTSTNQKFRVEDITALELPYTEKKQALHYGISCAENNWIVTIDDDCYPSDDNWLRTMRDHIHYWEADILLGISPSISQSSWVNQWIRYDALQTTIQFAYYTILGQAYMGIGRNMAFKKDLWSLEYLKQYDQLGSGDDTTLVNFYRDTHKIKIFLHPFVYTFPKTNFGEWLMQKVRHVHKGRFMSISMQYTLAKPLMLSAGFWLIMWIWLSFFAFHFAIFFLIILYALSKTYMHYRIMRHLKWKIKPSLYTFGFDAWYSFCLLILPFLSLIIKKRWRPPSKLNNTVSGQINS